MNKHAALFLLEESAFADAFGELELKRLSQLLRFPHPPVLTDRDRERIECLPGIEILITGWGMPQCERSLLSQFPDLRLVAHAGGSIKSIVTEEMWDAGVRAISAAKANAIPVAEFALSQIIFSLKHGWQRVREIERSRTYSKNDDSMPGAYRSTVGILSYGLIGRLLRKLLRLLEVDVVVYDPLLSPAECAGEGIELLSLEEVFARSDVVTCHTPQLPVTIGLIREEHFRAMRPGATFINTARGAVVNEAEMIRALRARSDLLAILDVTDPEPPQSGSPLYAMPNVVLTPHIAGSLGRECRRMGELVVAEIERFVRGQPLECELAALELPFIA